MESIKVVKIINNEPYRTILKKGEYKKNKNGQIILPKDYYSCGYFERISSRDWSKLPELIEKPKTKLKTESKAKKTELKTKSKAKAKKTESKAKAKPKT